MSSQQTSEEKPQIQYTISDLLDIVHMTIVKAKGENTIIFDELKSIECKLQAHQLTNYPVNKETQFRSMIANLGGEVKP